MQVDMGLHFAEILLLILWLTRYYDWSVWYHIYPKYLDALTPYHPCPKHWTFYYWLMCLRTAGWVVNSVDPDQMPQNVASDLGLHCLLRPVSLKIWRKCSTTLVVVSCRQFVFNQKILIFLFPHKSTCFRDSLESHHWGKSNDYPQPIFLSRNKRNIYLDMMLI